MKKVVALLLCGFLVAIPIICSAFQTGKVASEPEPLKQRAERIVISDGNGQAALTFILVYDEEGLPARFLLLDRNGQVFLSGN